MLKSERDCNFVVRVCFLDPPNVQWSTLSLYVFFSYSLWGRHCLRRFQFEARVSSSKQMRYRMGANKLRLNNPHSTVFILFLFFIGTSHAPVAAEAAQKAGYKRLARDRIKKVGSNQKDPDSVRFLCNGTSKTVL